MSTNEWFAHRVQSRDSKFSIEDSSKYGEEE